MPSKDDDDDGFTTAATIIPHNSISKNLTSEEEEEENCEVQEYSIKTRMFSEKNDDNNIRDLKEQSPMPPDEKEMDEEEENGEEQIVKTTKSKLDWEALIAAAEEDFDLLETPMDSAVKTLM
uniref:Uncharacterized protein n=1 Tax=Panagrolaimus superbus TaxID=310955 RepID=A0A914YL35_9BILA